MHSKNVYFNNFISEDTSTKLDYICITQSEADNKMLLENRSKSDITKLITDQLNNMEVHGKSTLVGKCFQKVSQVKNKNCCIKFYCTIMESITADAFIEQHNKISFS